MGQDEGLGYKSEVTEEKEPIDISKFFVFYVIVMLFFIPAYIKFYTGGILTALITGFVSNVGSQSNYSEYQKYFMESGLDEFSLSKLPFILGMGIGKFLFLFFVFYYVGFCKQIQKWWIGLIVLLFLLFAMVGVARGTSFENFESLVLLLFAYMVRLRFIHGTDSLSRTQMIYLGCFAAFVGFIFMLNMALRFDGDIVGRFSGPSSTLRSDENHWAMTIMPGIALVALKFAGYFTFPLYFVSEVFWKVWTDSFSGMMAAILPGVAPVLLDMENYRIGMENLGMDTAACWDPDCTTFIYFLGIPMFLVLVYYMGKYAAMAYNTFINRGDVLHCMLLFLLVYEMIAFPVGNFLIISSVNKIMLVLIVLIVYFDLFKKYRFI